MSKLIKRVLVIVLLAAGGFAFYMLQNDLDPLDFKDLEQAASDAQLQMKKIPQVVDGTIADSKESVIYKRKDAKGNWYYTNEPPREGEESETLIYRSDANVLPPLPDDKNKK